MRENIFSSLPSCIKDKIHDGREFKRLIRNFLYCNNFYTSEDYFNYKIKNGQVYYHNPFYYVTYYFMLSIWSL
jgi:hypothetical protein